MHRAGNHRIVRIAVEAAEGKIVAEDAPADLECGEMSGEKDHALPLRLGGVEVLLSDDPVRGHAPVGAPPGRAGLEKADADRRIMALGEGVPLVFGKFRETEGEIHLHHPPASREKAEGERPQARQGRAAPSTAAGKASGKGEAHPRGPVQRMGERAFPVAAAHFPPDFSAAYSWGFRAGSLYILNW